MLDRYYYREAYREFFRDQLKKEQPLGGNSNVWVKSCAEIAARAVQELQKFNEEGVKK